MAAATFLDLVSGILTRKSAVEAGPASGPTEQIVSTNAAGVIDATLIPGSVGGGFVVLASENLAAGDFVNVYNNAGVANVRKADASTTGKTASGFVSAAVLSGANATVYAAGGQDTGLTAVTPGEVYLSDTTPGGFLTTPPSTAGHVVQRIGVGISTTAIVFEPYAPITLT